MELRIGLLDTPLFPQVRLGVTIISIDTPIEDVFYEIWWDFHDDKDSDKYFTDIAKQDQLVIEFWGDSGTVEHRITIKNPLKSTFQQWLSILKKTTSWSVKEFNLTRNKIYSQFPTVDELWNTLSEPLEN